MKGNLRLHMICALSSITPIFILCLDALAPSNKEPCAVPRLFHANRAGTDDDHDYRPPRRNTQRG